MYVVQYTVYTLHADRLSASTIRTENVVVVQYSSGVFLFSFFFFRVDGARTKTTSNNMGFEIAKLHFNSKPLSYLSFSV